MAATPRRKLSTRGGAPAQERELRAQGKKTMRKLRDAAKTVFEKRGYHAARVDDIVKVAKTSHGTFYLYFANKEDLFRTLTADVAEEMTGLLESLAPITADDDGYRELRQWLGRFTDVHQQYGPVLRAVARAGGARRAATDGWSWSSQRSSRRCARPCARSWPASARSAWCGPPSSATNPLTRSGNTWSRSAGPGSRCPPTTEASGSGSSSWGSSWRSSG